MLTVREVAKFYPSDSPDSVFVEIVKELNQESLDGITEWSHVWLVILDSSGSLQMHPCEIQKRDGRKLILSPLENFSTESTIIDIKPIHACDINT